LNILITTHRDGAVLARACGYYGLKSIRGSGGGGSEFLRKKALDAFAAMLRVLRKGENVVMTADVPKVARVAAHPRWCALLDHVVSPDPNPLLDTNPDAKICR
jgi:lysophospholipid acyltransferase (LPLAT)-like uncharacterized protein